MWWDTYISLRVNNIEQ